MALLCFAWLWWCLTSHGVTCISMCFTYTSCITMYFVTSLPHCHQLQQANSLIAGFMGPTWGPAGADRTQLGPMLALWTLLSGLLLLVKWPKRKWVKSTDINPQRVRQNGRHFADGIFQCIFLNENVWISFQISLKFVPEGSINNIPAVDQILAWHWPGSKPSSEPMMA